MEICQSTDIYCWYIQWLHQKKKVITAVPSKLRLVVEAMQQSHSQFVRNTDKWNNQVSKTHQNWNRINMKGSRYLQYAIINKMLKKKKENQPITDLQTHPKEIFIELQISGTEGGHMSTYSIIFHPPTFYFSPVDRHLCYGDFKTLGNIQELHIKSPVTGKTQVHSSCSTVALKFMFYCRLKKTKHTVV